MRNVSKAIVAGTVGVLALTGCSIANTTAQSKALQYGNGPFDSKAFVQCIDTNTKEIDDVADDYVYYPVGDRTYKFSTDEGSEAAPLGLATKDGIELVSRGTVVFTLNTSCAEFTDTNGKSWPGGKLQKFHETIGSKFGAGSLNNEDAATGEGWNSFINTYVKDVIDRTIDAEGQKYGWQELYNEGPARQQWEKAVIESVPQQINAQMGEDFLQVKNILLQKPDVPDALKNELANKQGADLRAQSVEIDKRAAESFPGGITAYQAYQQQQAMNKAIADGKIPILPVPQGSPIIVSPK